MSNETIIRLVEDLTTRLSAVTTEFTERAEQFKSAVVADDRAIDDQMLAGFAETLLEQRRVRRNYLPGELFHEPAWDMMIALFVAHCRNRTMNIKALVAMSDAPVTTSQRWIEHLYKLKLINRVVDPGDRRRVEISLNDAGYTALQRYLTAMIRL